MSTTVSPVTSQISANNVSQSADNNELAKAIKENNNTAKTCSYVALGTSVATLLPLSVLAIRSGKISKAAEGIHNSAKPILENLSGASKAVKDVAEAARNKAVEVLETFKSDEVEGLVNEISEKVKDADLERVIDTVTTSIKSLTEKANGKIDEVNLKQIEELLCVIKGKISEINVPGLSAKAEEVLGKISGKI